MIEFAIIAFSTYFATIAPIDVAAVYPGLTPDSSLIKRRQMAIKGVLIAFGILVVFILFGNLLLKSLGITLPSLRIAGGILLMLMAIDMVFARHSGGVSTTRDEDTEAGNKNDISVFPLSSPLIAGPGSMGASILLAAEGDGDPVKLAIVLLMLAAVLIITLGLLLVATNLHKYLGLTGLNVITRIVGILLAALAVQFVIDGLKGAGFVT